MMLHWILTVFVRFPLGRLGDAYVVASETCAFDIVGAEFIRDVEPGELIDY